MLALAHTGYEIVNAILDNIPRAGHEDADRLADAMFVRDLAERLVREAVVAECEQGASWAALARTTGTTRQSAHHRWSSTVEGWALMGRRRTGIGAAAPSHELATNLDAWYADLDARRSDAVTSTLPSYGDPARRAAAQAERRAAAELRVTIEQLHTEAAEAGNASMAAIGTPEADRCRTAWATARFALAGAYDRLAAAEAPLGRDHKRSAGRERALGQEILAGGRDSAPQPTPEPWSDDAPSALELPPPGSGWNATEDVPRVLPHD